MKGGIADKTSIKKKIPKNAHSSKLDFAFEYNKTVRIAPIVNNDKDRIRRLFLVRLKLGGLFLTLVSLKLKKHDKESELSRKSMTIINPNQNICGSIPLPI
jgi:hypothetical protein